MLHNNKYADKWVKCNQVKRCVTVDKLEITIIDEVLLFKERETFQNMLVQPHDQRQHFNSNAACITHHIFFILYLFTGHAMSHFLLNINIKKY